MNVLALALFVLWFLVTFVLRSAMQKRSTGDSGIRAGVLTSGATALEVVAGWMLVAASVVGFVAPIAAMAGFPQLWDNRGVALVGLVIVAVGVVATFAAQVAMGRNWRIGIDKTERTDLVTSAAFNVVRNPVFSAMLLTATGFCLLVPSVLTVAAFVLLLVAIELQVRFVEEPHLRTLHAESYSTYLATVGRFVPRIGRESGHARS